MILTAIATFGDVEKFHCNHGTNKHSTIRFKYPYPTQPLSEENSVHQAEQRVMLHTHCCKELCQQIMNHQIKHGVIFDIVIFMPSNTIITQFPMEKGTYYCPYYNFLGMEFPNVLPCVEIVSFTHVRVNGGKIVCIQALNLELRKAIFDALFGGYVVDFENFEDLSNPEIDDVAVFIPSVINTSSNPFDYTACRSIYTPQERIEQTKRQLLSIGTEQNCTYLLEGSPLDLKQIEELFSTTINGVIVLFSNDPEGCHYANEHPNKSAYEIYVMRKMLEVVDAQWYFKFGGRYKIENPNYLTNFLKDTPIYKTIDAKYTFGGKDIVECVMYCFPKKFKQEYLDMYLLILECAKTTGEGIETLLYRFSPPFKTIETIGANGFDAIEGFYRNI